ncbi:MAG: 50S ribosomal protein L15 [bacterium]|nr:50S ribosomal protein L15 [bacterium]
MNILSSLPAIVALSKKRLGRGTGSGAGNKSGRGTTRHQTARTDIPLHFEGGQNRFTKRFPLLRGKGRNKVVNPKSLVVTIEQLSKLKTGTEVSQETLLSEGIISSDDKNRNIKVVGGGTIDIVLTVRLPVTKSAKEAIEKAGGKVE